MKTFQSKIFFVGISSLLLGACSDLTPEVTHFDYTVTDNDGSKSAPVVLAVDSSEDYAKVGSSLGSQNTSYYKFNSGSNTELLIVTSNNPAHDNIGDYTLKLYSDSKFSNLIGTFEPTDSELPIIATTTNTNYYFTLTNNLTENTRLILIVRTPYSPKHTGSLASPKNINVAPSYWTSFLVANSSGDKIAYIKIRAGTSGTLTINYKANEVDGTLYANSDFATGYITGETSSFSSTISATVVSGTDYYLKLEDFGPTGYQIAGYVWVEID